ncbi:MAG: PAS domain S-box protein [Magnetococcales bacterium]|nr:PAS domain S-box protein [Magnetococcales bacterium]
MTASTTDQANPDNRRRIPNTVIFLGIFLPSVLVTKNYDVFEIFISWVRQQDVWFLDEVVSMLILCILPFLTFLTYRLMQLNTALRQNERTILGLSRQNELILNAVGDGIFGLDSSGKVTFINPSAEKMLGITHTLAMERHYQKLIYQKTKTTQIPSKNLDAITATFLDQQSHHADDEQFYRMDQTAFPVEYACTPIFQNKQLSGVVITFRDISERKRTEAKMARLAEVVRQTADMTIITDNRGIIEYVNPAFERISLFSQKDVLNRPSSLLKSDQQDPLFYSKMARTLNRGKIWKDRFISRKKDGSLFHIDVIISPIRDRRGEIIHFVAMARDVTHEVELGRQLRRSQRLEAVGTLAGGISHDFNNILTAILSYTDLAMDDLPEQSLAYQNLQEVMVAATRARDLIKQLLTFSRRGERVPVPLFLSEAIQETVKLLKALLPSNITFNLQLSSDEFQVMADPTRIHQVIMNLCTNAAQAMWDREGQLDILLEKARIDKNIATKTIALATIQEGDYMLLTIRDNGCGIQEADLDRIFEPFFSTKGVGKGSGLGLSVVLGIIQNHQGIIHVQSKPGIGSTFQVYLPGLEIQKRVLS